MKQDKPKWTSSRSLLPAHYPLHGLLVHRDLLTVELRRIFGAEVSIQLLQACETSDGEYIRRVIILCGQQQMIYAETQMPVETLGQYPWLRELGGQSLGSQMSRYGQISRGEYTYCQLEKSHALHRRVLKSTGDQQLTAQSLWTRRFQLTLNEHSVEITEVFLPAVAGD